MIESTLEILVMLHKVKFFGLHANILAMSAVSFLMNISASMIAFTAGLYMTNNLGVSLASAVFVRQLSESLGYIIKPVSGYISDFFQKRKPMIMIGYGTLIFVKPMFALSVFFGTFAFLVYGGTQIIDRLLNGFRDAPRDALIADSSDDNNRGKAFGIRKAMASIGSIVGGYLAFKILNLTGDDFQFLYIMAVVPIAVVILIIYFGINDINISQLIKKNKNEIKLGKKLSFSHFNALPFQYWFMLFIIFVFFLSRFTEMFIQYRSAENGFIASEVSLIMAWFYFAISIGSFILSTISDTIGRKKAIMIAMCIAALGNFILFQFDSSSLLLFGIFLSGIQFGAIEGILNGIITDIVPIGIRGTAFGISAFVMGMGTYFANDIARNIDIVIAFFNFEFLMDSFSVVRIAYLFAAVVALISILLVLFYKNCIHTK